VIAALWLIASSLRDPLLRLFGKGPRQTIAMLGMQIAHFGLGLFVIGVTVTGSYGLETDQRVALGETLDLAGYELRFADLRQVEGPNYTAVRAQMELRRGDKLVKTLYPEKRIYRVQQSPMTEAAIDDGWSRDVFVALGEDLGLGAWSVRLQYKPLIRFIWFGCVVMAFGGFIAISDRRYRRGRVSAAEQASAAPASAG
jgi:cytochrome c-type biogenesis protein CcmF